MNEAEKRVIEAQDADVRLAAAILVRDKLAVAAEAAVAAAGAVLLGSEEKRACRIETLCTEALQTAEAECVAAQAGIDKVESQAASCGAMALARAHGAAHLAANAAGYARAVSIRFTDAAQRAEGKAQQAETALEMAEDAAAVAWQNMPEGGSHRVAEAASEVSDAAYTATGDAEAAVSFVARALADAEKMLRDLRGGAAAEAAEAAASRTKCLEHQAGIDDPELVLVAGEGIVEAESAAALLWGRVALILRQVPGVSGPRDEGGENE